MKIAIITTGYFPVPATKGGAVEALDEYIIQQNEIYKKLDLNLFSTYDSEAVQVSKRFKYSQFYFVKVPKYIKILDQSIYWIAKNILKRKKHMSYRYILQRLHFISSVSKTLQKESFDKVILENHPTLFMIIKKRKNDIKYKNKYYYHLHNMVTSDYGCRDIMNGTEKVLGVSNYINSTFEKFMLSALEKNRFAVLKNCVDEKRFNNEYSTEDIEEVKKKYGIASDEKIVLFTGRLNEEKGIRELLIAYKKVEYSKAKLLIVGSYYFGSKMLSEYEVELKELAKNLGDKIIFTGYVDYKSIPKLYAIADVVVIPSIWDDPAPLTVIEALTAGKPLITTYSGGIPEYANTQCSIILERDEMLIENIANAIDKLLNDNDLRTKLSLEARKIAKKWTLKNYYEDFIGLIR
ncbi:MAG: glycosyltransferase family 4 protein [Clostridium beijerinckii]|nr:glycosyltransferase family 4 protein [Clostridium beijerinckii]